MDKKTPFIMYLKESIKNIKEKVNKKLNELKLIPERPLDSHFILKANHYYVTPCVSRNQIKYLFKSSLRDEKQCLFNLAKEIYFHRHLLRYSSKKINFIPRYITSGKEGKFIWILREYIAGKTMGDLREINKNFVRKKHISLILQEIFLSREVAKEIFSSKNCPIKLPRTTYAHNFYLKEKDKLDYHPFIFKKEIKRYQTKEIDFEKVLNFYRKYRRLLADSLTITVHGDLNPKNLLITPDDKIYIIDWDRIHWDNLVSEIDFLWASAWNYQDWQAELLKQYFAEVKNKDKFITLWRLGIIARCWGEAWCWYHQMRNTTNKKVVSKCKQAITTNLDYLYRATQGFENFF